MTHLLNSPDQFRAEAMSGLASCYPQYLTKLEDASGFVSTAASSNRVQLLIGGGSGHYPSYGGILGPGFADGAVLGEVFTSPSSEQIYRVAMALEPCGGLVMAFGNYSGDRLNFAAARERLLENGVDTRIVFVTDDIASATPEEAELRRGVAGTFIVYKIGAAAASRGADLDFVEQVMVKTNKQTFSLGVAFSGCTLPGATEPLFHVEPGICEMGLGIHGEPGISGQPLATSSDLAEQLLHALLVERPTHSSDRVALLVNGLGSTKYEELAVFFNDVAQLLAAAGLEMVLPEIGEMVTSLDMSGASISICWLDDELEELWAAPADTISFKRTELHLSKERFIPKDRQDTNAQKLDRLGQVNRSAVDQKKHDEFVRITENVLKELAHRQAELGRLDAVAGDGDHGTGMARGAKAACAIVDELPWANPAQLLVSMGPVFSDQAGGTSGILWGIFLEDIGNELEASKSDLPVDIANSISHAVDLVQRVGGANIGDKTLLDSMIPFSNSLTKSSESGIGFVESWCVAADIASNAAAATSDLIPRIGRARVLAGRSRGSPDPGATSFALIVTCIANSLIDNKPMEK